MEGSALRKHRPTGLVVHRKHRSVNLAGRRAAAPIPRGRRYAFTVTRMSRLPRPEPPPSVANVRKSVRSAPFGTSTSRTAAFLRLAIWTSSWQRASALADDYKLNRRRPASPSGLTCGRQRWESHYLCFAQSTCLASVTLNYFCLKLFLSGS